MTPSYSLGLFFIFLVSIIWAAASIVVQHLYRDMDFDSPFLLTYVSTSLFVLFLPTRLLWERRKRIRRWVCFVFPLNGRSEYRAVEVDDDCPDGGFEHEDEQIIPWRHCQGVVLAAQEEYSEVTHTATGEASAGTLEMMTADGATQGEEAVTYQTADASPRGENGTASDGNGSKDGDDNAESSDLCLPESSLCENDDCIPYSPSSTFPCSSDPGEICSTEEYRNKCSLHTAETSASSISDVETAPVLRSTDVPHLLSHVDHIRMALRIGPVWFLSNYFYNTSLAYTSISSSTVLASTGSLFTFLFAVTCGDEKVNALKLAGVSLCFVGSVLTGLSDAEAAGENEGPSHINATYFDMPTASLDETGDEDASFLVGPSQDSYNSSQLLGDLAGLISALGYGTYTVLIRTLCPKDESKMSMQLLLGYIGGINGLVLLPVAIKMVFFDSCDSQDDVVFPPGDMNAGVPGASEGASGSASSCQRLTLVVVAYLLGKAFFDNVLSDYLWARAVILTSATVATVGLGLTIPLAFFSDWFMGHDDVVSLQSVAGAIAVLFGFIFVNCGETRDEEDIAQAI